MYIYNDEDNVPMTESREEAILRLTTYSSRAEMKVVENGEIPFNEKPADGCWNCINYHPGKGACTIRWNNLDESYYNPDLDNREPTDHCDSWEKDPDAVWEDYFGEEK